MLGNDFKIFVVSDYLFVGALFLFFVMNFKFSVYIFVYGVIVEGINYYLGFCVFRFIVSVIIYGCVFFTVFSRERGRLGVFEFCIRDLIV